MTPFRAILSEEEIADVAAFAFDRLVRRRAYNAAYHSVENGWPDHDKRYAAAYPFVLGLRPTVETGRDLTSAEGLGLRLFREACTTCHEESAPRPPTRQWRLPTEPQGEARAIRHGLDHGDDPEGYNREATAAHDEAPRLDNLTRAEAKGELLYQQACAYCHAADGTGENWIGEFLRPHPTDFTDPRQPERLTDEAMERAILDGLPQTSMPAFRAVLDLDQVKAIIAYLRRAFLRSNPHSQAGRDDTSRQ